MTDNDTWAKLRKPFPAAEVGKLPRVTCGDCSDRRKECTKHSKSKCRECGAYVSEKHIHIDYVGHADVTSRLLEADPEWGWDFRSKDIEPAVLAAAAAAGPDVLQVVLDNAPPKFDLDRNGETVGLWIKLTVGGVTRPGYGSCPSGQGDAVKVLIGDALRNAAMRFGVALDLWAKGDRADPTAENATASAGKASRGRSADPFEDATPARPRNDRPQSQADRPAVQAAPDPDAEIDEEAQALADEASTCLSVSELRKIHAKGLEKNKLRSYIADPAAGTKGQLGPYLNFRKKALEATDAAWTDLYKAAEAHHMEVSAVEDHVRKVSGRVPEAATVADIRKAINALKAAA